MPADHGDMRQPSAAAARRRVQEELDRNRILLSAAAAVATLRLDEVLQSLSDALLLSTGCDRVMLQRYDPLRDELSISGVVQGERLEHGIRVHVSSLSPELREILTARRGRVLDYESREVSAEAREEGRTFGVRRGLYLPMAVGDRLLGVVGVDECSRRHEFSEREIELAEGIVAQAAVALEHARLYEDALEHARLGDALDRVNTLIHSTLEPAEVLERALAETARALKAPCGIIEMRDGDGWVVRHQYGFETDYRGERFGTTPVSLVPGCPNDPVLLGPLRADDPRVKVLRERFVLVSMMGVPLFDKDALAGVMYLQHTEPSHEFAPADVEFGRRVGASVSLAIENAGLYERQRESMLLNERLTHIDGVLHSTLEFDEIVDSALEEGARAVGADAAAVAMHEGSHFRISHVFGWPEQRVGTLVPDDEEWHSTLAMATAAAVAIDDASHDERVSAELMASLGIRSLIVCPLIVKNEPVGVIFYDYRDRPHRFSPAEVTFVSRVTSSLSLALENAQLYAGERTIAQTLQRALLALPEDVEGVRMAHAYHSATYATRVGGDFYDVFELDNGLLGLVVGDVSGKGLDAAVLTALVKNTIRAHAVVKGNRPSDIMRQANAVVLKESRPETFVTVFFGMLDRRDGRFVYCNAGHPPPALVRAPEDVALLVATSPIIGAFDAAPFSDAETHVRLHEKLLLYTDGLTEARIGRELYGEARLLAALAESAAADCDETIEMVISDALAFAGGSLSDDLAVLALRRVDLPPETPVQQKLRLWEGIPET